MQLSNQYWLLRHGRSKANEAGLIVSNVEDGTSGKYGLAEPRGIEQARAAGRKLAACLGTGARMRSLVIYASPFTRTMETAQYAAEAMDLPPNTVQVATELRERYFGQYDLTPDTAYLTVWARDTQDAAAHVPGGGETVEDVAQRLRALLRRIESSHGNSDVLLVSHGDTLSIFAAVALGLDLTINRRYGLDTGQLLKLSELSQLVAGT